MAITLNSKSLIDANGKLIAQSRLPSKSKILELILKYALLISIGLQAKDGSGVSQMIFLQKRDLLHDPRSLELKSVCFWETLYLID